MVTNKKVMKLIHKNPWITKRGILKKCKGSTFTAINKHCQLLRRSGVVQVLQRRAYGPNYYRLNP